jgi:hypothetical protein
MFTDWILPLLTTLIKFSFFVFANNKLNRPLDGASYLPCLAKSEPLSRRDRPKTKYFRWKEYARRIKKARPRRGRPRFLGYA